MARIALTLFLNVPAPPLPPGHVPSQDKTVELESGTNCFSFKTAFSAGGKVRVTASKKLS